MLFAILSRNLKLSKIKKSKFLTIMNLPIRSDLFNLFSKIAVVANL